MIEAEIGSGNVFADLGVDNPEVKLADANAKWHAGMVDQLRMDLAKSEGTVAGSKCEGCGALIFDDEEACHTGDIVGCWPYVTDDRAQGQCWRYRTEAGMLRAWPEIAMGNNRIDEPEIPAVRDRTPEGEAAFRAAVIAGCIEDAELGCQIVIHSVGDIYDAAARALAYAGPLPLASTEPWAESDQAYRARLSDYLGYDVTYSGSMLDDYGVEAAELPRARLVLAITMQGEN
jgi:hypothetical protein